VLLQALSGGDQSSVKQIAKIARNPSGLIADDEQCPAGIPESRAY
jgi:hypothetical protein